jgi:hypothetical protein
MPDTANLSAVDLRKARKQLWCVRGHPLEGPNANVYIDKRGVRVCRECKKLHARAHAITERRGQIMPLREIEFVESYPATSDFYKRVDWFRQKFLQLAAEATCTQDRSNCLKLALGATLKAEEVKANGAKLVGILDLDGMRDATDTDGASRAERGLETDSVPTSATHNNDD